MGHTFTAAEMARIGDLSMRVKALTAFLAESVLYGDKLVEETATLAQMASESAAALETMLDA